MNTGTDRQLVRHLLATISFRLHVALADAPSGFQSFRIGPEIRTPGEILAHIGDLIEGTGLLMKGELIYLNSSPLAWTDEIERVFSALRSLDSFLTSDSELAHPIEKFVQGPIADALSHTGQIVMLRRAAGSPVKESSYFSAALEPGDFSFRP